MGEPWRIWVVFKGEHIRKWDHKPFEIDGVEASEFQVANVAGLHTCSDSCDRPLCVARRRIAELEA